MQVHECVSYVGHGNDAHVIIKYNLSVFRWKDNTNAPCVAVTSVQLLQSTRILLAHAGVLYWNTMQWRASLRWVNVASLSLIR